MSKKITALLLAFALALSCLTGCGSSNSGSSSGGVAYVGEALGFYDTLEGIRSVQDAAFQLSVSIPQEDADDVQLFTASGVYYASTKQARVEILDQNGDALTEIYVDGSTCYFQYSELVDFIVRTYENSEEKDALTEDLDALQDFQQDAPDYYSIQLEEDLWTTLEGDSTQEARELLSKLYSSVKRETSDNSKENGDTYRFSLGGDDLQTQISSILSNLLTYKTTYRTVLEDYLNDNFETFLSACAYTAEEVVDLYWDEFDRLQTELEEQAVEGVWSDWQVTANTCGDEENGYTVDFTRTGDTTRRYVLTVSPAEAEEITMPDEATDYLENVDDSAYVYYAFRNACRLLTDPYDADADADDDAEPDLADEDGEWTDSEDAYLTELEVSALSGYERISSALAATDDGVDREVPVFTDYTDSEVITSESSDGATDIYQASDGYSLEWYSLDATTRTLEEIVSDNLEGYETVYGEDWGYEILQSLTEVQISEDGTSAVAAIAYHDDDADSDVTMLNVAVQVDGSDYALCVEICLYSESVMNKEINAAKDLLQYLGLELPIDVLQS